MAKRYKLSKKDKDKIHKLLDQYHKLFPNLKCKGDCLEHIVAKALNGQVKGGHDKETDIVIKGVGIQIKSGEIKDEILTISGHRLTRFGKDFKKIDTFLKSTNPIIVSVPAKKDTFEYSIYEINSALLKPTGTWAKKGKSYYQTNKSNVQLSISPSMSWQIWWKIPISKLED